MDFSLTEEQQMFGALFSDFASKEVAGAAEQTDREEALPPDLLRKAAAQGFLGATLPEQYGGAGMDYQSYMLLAEALGRHCLSFATAIGIHTTLSAMTIVEGGSEATKAEFLPRLAAGDLGTFALTEPEAGSDAGALQTRAVRDGDHYTLNGVKAWVSNAGQAGAHVVIAVTTPGERHHGVSAFVVDAQAPGIFLGQREPTLGLRGLDIRTVYFEDCHVPAENLLGEVDHGWTLVQHALQRVRLSLAAAALGAADGALSLGLKFATERKQFGVAIGEKQAIQNYVADCAVEIEALRHMVQHTAWLADQGHDYESAASMAKYFGARVARDTANKMLQVHGGYGFSDEYAISRIYRDVRALRLLGGTDEIQRFAVARELFGAEGLAIQP